MSNKVDTTWRINSGVTEQTVITMSASSQSTSAFNAKTLAILVSATQACHITIGDAPTATANSFYLPANFPMIFGVAGSQKLAVIQDGTNTGKVTCTELTH